MAPARLGNCAPWLFCSQVSDLQLNRNRDKTPARMISTAMGKGLGGLLSYPIAKLFEGLAGELLDKAGKGSGANAAGVRAACDSPSRALR